MEALRNHVQHRGFPIHALEYNSTLSEKEPRNRFRFGVAVYTKTTYLREDGDFKASVLVELEALGGRIDLKPLIRDYIASLAAIHERVRVHHRAKIADWEAKFVAAIQRFKSSFPSEPSLAGLAAVKFDGHKRSDEINLFPGFIEHRKYLEAKNRGFGNLANRYVTGQVKDGDA